MARRSKAAAAIPAVPAARVVDAQELRRAVEGLDWGREPVHLRGPELQAFKAATDALWAARIAQPKGGPLTMVAQKHQMAARLALAGVIGDRAAWLVGMLYAAERAEAATDPDECAVLDADVRRCWASVRGEWLKDRGREEERRASLMVHGNRSANGGRGGKGKYKLPHVALFRRAAEFLEQHGRTATPSKVRQLLCEGWQQLVEIGDPLPDIVTVNVRDGVIDVEYTDHWRQRHRRCSAFVEVSEDALKKTLLRRAAV